MAYQDTFGTYLSYLRSTRGLSNRDLAAKAEVPHSLVAGLQAGSRRVGEVQARRIGAALGLTDDKLEQFVLRAVDTCSEKILKIALAYPANLLNFLALGLRSAGIYPEHVDYCEVGHNDVAVILNNGRRARINTSVALL